MKSYGHMDAKKIYEEARKEYYSESLEEGVDYLVSILHNVTSLSTGVLNNVEGSDHDRLLNLLLLHDEAAIWLNAIERMRE